MTVSRKKSDAHRVICIAIFETSFTKKFYPVASLRAIFWFFTNKAQDYVAARGKVRDSAWLRVFFTAETQRRRENLVDESIRFSLRLCVKKTASYPLLPSSPSKLLTAAGSGRSRLRSRRAPLDFHAAATFLQAVRLPLPTRRSRVLRHATLLSRDTG